MPSRAGPSRQELRLARGRTEHGSAGASGYEQERPRSPGRHDTEGRKPFMNDVDCGCLPVAERDWLAGIITDRDIAFRTVAKGKASGQMQRARSHVPRNQVCIRG